MVHVELTNGGLASLARRFRGRLPARTRVIEAGPASGLRIGRRDASADYAQGVNELPVQIAIADSLRAGGVFFDVGANVGFFSLLAARIVGPSGGVVAIEPVPANVRRVEANARRNGFRNISVIEAAAAGSSGTTRLNLARHPGGAVLESAGTPPDPSGWLNVRTVCIDELVAEGSVRAPTVVKIDVEGAELEVLSGLDQTIRTHRPVVVCEVDGRDEGRLAAAREAIVGVLEAAGCSVEVLERSYAATDWRVDHVVGRPVAVAP